MSRAPKQPIIEKQPEIIFSPGRPLLINNAPNGRALASDFLQDFAAHYHAYGKGIFAEIYENHPTHYWARLITLAKVLKIEIGQPHDFERPSTKEEALDQLQRRAGPAARQMLEKFLDQVATAEAEYRDQTDTATSFKDAASRRR
jgi:hypothetical protein